MASSANPNPQLQQQPQPQPQPFDVHNFFKPSAPAQHQNPPPGSFQNPGPPPMHNSPPFPIPPSSYPPPSAAGLHYPQQTAPFPHPYQYQFYQNPNPHHILPPNQIPFAPEQRSLSFPAPPLQPPPMANNSPNSGARIMALLGAPSTSVEFPPPIPAPVAMELAGPPPPQPGAMGGPARMPSSKLPKGRHLGVEHAVYDVDVRLSGEVQPQLEVTPITKYGSDPQLVLGRQIAVNKSYICYGLKQGNIRVLNIHTALRALFRAHTQRVTDMAFFAEDVHLLASVSVEGRLYVWKISEGPDEEGTPQITGKIMVAAHIVGEDEALHPRICWHCHKQEMLVVGYGKLVLRIDTTKFGKGETFSAEEPLKCHVDKLIDGVQLVGKHDGEITDLSMCQWMVTRLVSASMDGTIKIWEDRKAQPLVVLRPHNGQPVNAATFLTAPHRPDHIVLITAGPLNREVKIWASASEEGWLLPSDAESWKSTQTLELKSSVEQRVEDAFFNQVVSLPHAGLVLLANAKKNAIYAIHLEYGPNPISTSMDYIAEFTVTMPILSFTGISITSQGEHILQVYCVQTQAIQQYALDLLQCLPPPLENSGLDRSESNLSATEAFSAVDRPVSPALKPNAHAQIGSSSESALRYPGGSNSIEISSSSPNTDSNPAVLTPSTSDADITGIPSPPPPLSPRLSGRFAGLRAPVDNFGSGSLFSDHVGEQVNDYSVDRQVDQARLSDVLPVDDGSRNDERKASQDDFSSGISPSAFKYPTHLITPSEIFMASSSPAATPISNEGKGGSEGNIEGVLVSVNADNSELEVRGADETSSRNDSFGVQEESQNDISESKEKYFCSQASDLGLEMARDCCAISSDTHIAEEQQHLAEPSHVNEEYHDAIKDVSARASQSSAPPAAATIQTPNTKAKKKGKGSQASSSSPCLLNSVDSSSEAGVGSSLDAVASPQIFAMQETLNQLMSMQKEMQKQISTMVALPIAKEGKRLEAAFGRSMEKSIKANNDALWARIQEENAKTERLIRERTQQTTAMVSNFMSKDLPALLEKTLKKEMTTVGPAVARAISPAIEKAISSVIADSFQRGIGDKAVTQLEKSVNSKLETTVARQIQAQFQTSGRQALQESLKSCFEVLVIPAFELSCKAMFEQVDATFQKGISEHANANNQDYAAAQSHLAHTLREAINAASSVAQTLSGELADGQRKLIALAATGDINSGGNLLISQLSNGPLGALHDKVEAPLDPTKELSRLISEHKYDEAFNRALQRSDVNIVSWLCSQVNPRGNLSMAPLSLSQGVLLSLLQQLACDISNDTSRKIAWMTDVAAAINPADPMIAVHVRPIFEQVYNILHNQRSLPTVAPPDQTSMRLLMHVINSMIMSCK